MERVVQLLARLTKRYGIAVSLSFILAGGIYLAVPYAYFSYVSRTGISANRHFWTNQPLVDETASTGRPPLSLFLGTPAALELPRLNIKLGISEGAYDSHNQTWQLDRTHAFFVAPGNSPLQKTALPLIYGHNIPGVFRNLTGIAIGEPLYVTDIHGRTVVFKYIGSKVIRPEQGTLLNQSEAGANITLLTCTGANFANRQLAYFHYVGNRPVHTQTQAVGAKT